MPGKNRRAHDGEERHRFGRTIDRGAPFLSEQKQNRGDERAGVPDTDPENEVGDVPGPADRMIQSPGADAGGNLVTETEQTERGDRRGDRESDPPPTRRALFDRAGDPFRQPTEVAFIQHQRRALERLLDRSRSLALDHFRCCGCAIHFQIVDLVVVDLILFLPVNLRHRSVSRPAFSDLDCECARDNSSAYSHSDIRAADNCGPALSFSKRGFPDL